MTSSPEAGGLLVVQNLRREFDGVVAVQDVSFTVPPGSIVGLIGPNGAGKSTVIGMIGGAIRPTSGSIRLDGAEISGLLEIASAEGQDGQAQYGQPCSHAATTKQVWEKFHRLEA